MKKDIVVDGWTVSHEDDWSGDVRIVGPGGQGPIVYLPASVIKGACKRSAVAELEGVLNGAVSEWLKK